MEWKKALENFKTYLILEKGLSKNTVQAYLTDITKLAEYCSQKEKPIKPKKVTHGLLTEFIININNLGATPRSQSRCISSIRSFFRFLVYDDVIKNNPASNLDAPRLERTLPDVLSVEEVELIINSADTSKAEGQRNKAIVETLYSCGLRVSELVSIKISNINFKIGYIKINGKGNKERIVPLSSKAREEIEYYIAHNRKKDKLAKGFEDILFINKWGKSLSRIMVFNIIKELTLKAGINKNVSPHTFRHSFASHLVDGGADIRVVQDMLGHESIITTEIYSHLDNSFLRDTIVNFHPRVRKYYK